MVRAAATVSFSEPEDYYIYIYIYREREIYTHIMCMYISIYLYIYIFLWIHNIYIYIHRERGRPRHRRGAGARRRRRGAPRLGQHRLPAPVEDAAPARERERSARGRLSPVHIPSRRRDSAASLVPSAPTSRRKFHGISRKRPRPALRLRGGRSKVVRRGGSFRRERLRPESGPESFPEDPQIIRGNDLFNTTCLTHVFFKSDKLFGKFS